MRTQRLYRTAAVVLRRQDFGEADRILTLYSPTIGKFRAIAKGTRRPKSRLGGHVELFTQVNVLVAQGRNLDIVTQAEAVRPFHGIRDDLWKAAYASYAAELVDRFTEERLENAAIFDLLLNVFERIDALPAVAHPDEVRESAAGEASEAMELCARNFEVRLLGHLGYGPELTNCTTCGRRLAVEENRFSPNEGGVLCATCGSVRPSARQISVNAIKALRLMSREPFGVYQRLHLTSDVSQEIASALRAHINFILEKQLRTSEFLDRMKADYRRALVGA
ncbi:MAG TPA: DNA repair protein RecO, partial [Chloroflexota bacterium]|nr:DNA repair protein RecO [Chloroflexota bacterium]